jgi:hypothetical protein
MEWITGTHGPMDIRMYEEIEISSPDSDSGLNLLVNMSGVPSPHNIVSQNGVFMKNFLNLSYLKNRQPIT